MKKCRNDEKMEMVHPRRKVNKRERKKTAAEYKRKKKKRVMTKVNEEEERKCRPRTSGRGEKNLE